MLRSSADRLVANGMRLVAFFVTGSVFLGVLAQSIVDHWLVLPGAAATFALLMAISVKKAEKRTFMVLFPLMVVCQLLAGHFLRMNFSTWDVYAVTKAARAFAGQAWHNIEYFARYPNNIAITLFFSAVFYVTDKLFGTMPIELLVFMNIIAIDLAVLLAVKTLAVLRGERTACRGGLLAVILSPLYLYVPIPYTDTFSMPLISLILYLSVLLLHRSESMKRWQKGLLTGGLGGLLMLSIRVKGSVAVLAVACVIGIVLRFRFRAMIKYMGCLAAGLLAVSVIYSAVVDATGFVPKEAYDKYQFPAAHWIMMGMHGRGSYDRTDVDFTISFPTYAERNQAVLSRIREQTEEMGAVGLIRQAYGKASGYGWNHGTFFAERYLGDVGDEPVSRSFVHEIILSEGRYFPIWKTVTQAIWLLIFGFAVIGMFAGFSARSLSPGLLMLQITMLGFMLFFMLWETHPRYILHASLFPVMLAATAMEKPIDWLEGRISQRGSFYSRKE